MRPQRRRRPGGSLGRSALAPEHPVVAHAQRQALGVEVLAAVVGELEKKLGKAREAISGGGAAAIREAVVEVEQAADSAKVAAEVDSGATDETRAAITAAHDRICLLKSEM